MLVRARVLRHHKDLAWTPQRLKAPLLVDTSILSKRVAQKRQQEASHPSKSISSDGCETAQRPMHTRLRNSPGGITSLPKASSSLLQSSRGIPEIEPQRIAAPCGRNKTTFEPLFWKAQHWGTRVIRVDSKSDSLCLNIGQSPTSFTALVERSSR